MHLDFNYSIAGLIVGFLVGLTGMGGGAVSTPILVLFFNVNPTIAVGTDLLYTSTTKIVGSFVHARQGTLDWLLVRRLAYGSIPGALVGVGAIQLLGNAADGFVKNALAIALLLAAAAIVARWVMTHRDPTTLSPETTPWRSRPGVVTLLGFVAGVLVGLTSVGSGTIIVASLLLLAPACGGPRLIGADIAHGAILTGVAGLASAGIGMVDWPMFSALLLGAVPAVIVGSRLAGHVNQKRLRPILVVVLTVSAVTMILKPG